MRSFVLLLAMAVSLASSAEVILWTNTSTGTWNDSLNWSPNRVPGSGDTAIITNRGVGNNPVTVRLDGNAAIGELLLGASSDCAGGQILEMNGPTLWLYGPLTARLCGQFHVNGGALVGVANAIIHGTLHWDGGLLNGSLTLASDGILEMTGSSHSLQNGVLTNYGTVNWREGDLHGGGSSPATLIYNYGVWDAQADLVMDNVYGANGTHFFNLGTLKKSGGQDSTVFRGVVLNQSGLLEVLTGTLSLEGDAHFTGGKTEGGGYIQLAAGSFNINGTATSTNVQLVGGGLSGVNLLQGGLSWRAGTWNNCQLTIANDCIVRIDGVRNDLANCLVTNYGTVIWASGTLRGGGSAPGGTTIHNYGLWDARSDQVFGDDYLANGTTFFNEGVFRKTGGSLATVLDGVQFVTTGSVDVQSGALSLLGGGTFHGGRTEGSGQILLGLGYFNLNGTLTSTNVQLVGGSLSGDNLLQGGFSWVNGKWLGVSVTIETNCLVEILGGSNHDLADSLIANYGTVHWAGGTLRGGGSAPGGTTIQNAGLFDIECDETLNSAYGANGVRFVNSGLLSKSAGSSTNTTIFAAGVWAQSSGVIHVQEGTLAFQGGGLLNGGSLRTGPGLIQLDAGMFTINGAETSTNVQLTGATLAGLNELHGGLTWISGTWAGSTVTICSNTLVLITSGSSNHDLPNCIVTNFGTVAWQGGNLRGGGSGPNTSVFNFGVWDAQCDRSINAAYGANGFYFLNRGTFRKSLGTNDTLLAAGVTFDNLGLVDAQTGNVGFSGTCLLGSSGTLRFGLSGPTDYGHIDITGTAALAGTLSADLYHGYRPAVGSSFMVLGYDSRSGLFADSLLPSACAWQTNYSAHSLSLSVLNAKPLLLPVPTQVMDELTMLRLTNLAAHPDAPAQTLRYGLDSGPMGMTLDPYTGVIEWTPGQPDALTTNLVRVWVQDDGGPPLSDTNSFVIVVREVNMPPQLPAISPQTVDELTLLTITNAAVEPDIHATTAGYALLSAPAGMTISQGGVVTWTPTQLQSPGTNIIAVMATNSDPFDAVNPHLATTNTFVVIVREVNVAPVLPNVPTQITYEQMPISIVNAAREENIHSTVSYRLVDPPAGMTISTNGVITWTPAHAQAPSTNLVTTIATNFNPYDLIHPHLSATNTLVVIVNERCVLIQAALLEKEGFQFSIETTTGTRYTIQHSTTLFDWEDLLSFVGPGGLITITDPNALQGPSGFYRIRMEP